MGFPDVPFIVLPKPLLLMLQLLDQLTFVLTLILYYLGLYPSSQVDHLSAAIYRTAEDLPSAATPPASTSSIKTRLPVVDYESFAKRYGLAFQQEEEPMCVVCLQGLEAMDEVRELGNCCHAFHKHCIDRWVELGQHTCPLCRAQLLPLERRKARGWLSW